jgi:hypothetical protein
MVVVFYILLWNRTMKPVVIVLSGQGHGGQGGRETVGGEPN